MAMGGYTLIYTTRIKIKQKQNKKCLLTGHKEEAIVHMKYIIYVHLKFI